jgi:hypothetical protein
MLILVFRGWMGGARIILQPSFSISVSTFSGPDHPRARYAQILGHAALAVGVQFAQPLFGIEITIVRGLLKPLQRLCIA